MHLMAQPNSMASSQRVLICSQVASRLEQGMVYMAENGFGIHGHVSFFGFIWVYDTLFSPSSQGFPAKALRENPHKCREPVGFSPARGAKGTKSPAQLPAGLGRWVRRPRPGGAASRCRGT